jgi:hypothetical protein
LGLGTSPDRGKASILGCFRGATRNALSCRADYCGAMWQAAAALCATFHASRPCRGLVPMRVMWRSPRVETHTASGPAHSLARGLREDIRPSGAGGQTLVRINTIFEDVAAEYARDPLLSLLPSVPLTHCVLNHIPLGLSDSLLSLCANGKVAFAGDEQTNRTQPFRASSSNDSGTYPRSMLRMWPSGSVR